MEREKSLLRVYREYHRLQNEHLNLGYERLEPPVQRGWKRFFVLRPDVAGSREAKLFQGILDRINTTEFSSRRDFRKKRRRGGRKVYEVRSQELLKLCTTSFAKKKFNEEEASYFDLVMADERPGSYYRWIYAFREPWRFQLKIAPNIIRRTKVKDFDLECRISDVSRYIDRNHLWPYIFKLRYGSSQWSGRYTWGGDLPRYRYDPLKNRTFAEVLDEYWPDGQNKTEIEKPPDDGGFSFLYLTFEHCVL